MYLFKEKNDEIREGSALGGIRYTKSGFVRKANDRPQWKKRVTRALPGAWRSGDRCHYFSRELMEEYFVAILNGSSDVEEQHSLLFRFMWIFVSLDMQHGDFDLWVEWLVLYGKMRKENNIYRKTTIYNEILSEINSTVHNLRFPVLGSDGNRWNRSVNSNYDPGEWCYLANGTVISDNTGLCDVDKQSYFSDLNMAVPSEDQGFFLLNSTDHYILVKIMDLGVETHVSVSIASASVEVDSVEIPFLFSSNNQFPFTNEYEEFSDQIFLPVGNQWHGIIASFYARDL